MRIESSVLSLSWIPSEAIQGMTKVPFGVGIAHYDDPPPEVIEDLAALEALRDADRFRFANRLSAWVEVNDGRITGSGYSGGGVIGSTTMRLGGKEATFAAVPLPDLQAEPEVGDGWVRFTQTAGGRTGVPAPRTVKHKPFVQFSAPLAWSTLQLTVYADGRSEFEVKGASPFPRHWIYGADGKLAAKTGIIDFKAWYKTAFGQHTPWGDEESPALVTEVESALEREWSKTIMTRGKVEIRKIKEGQTLTEQGEQGNELFLLLDGVLSSEVDGEPVADLGPGAILGERAILEGGTRTSTLRARTGCKVAVADADHVDRDALEEISKGHRREEDR
jgi:hypothetical protein